MGIPHLFSLIRKHAPQAIEPFNAAEHLAGKRVAIDAAITIYASLAGRRENDFSLVEDQDPKQDEKEKTQRLVWVDKFQHTANHVRGIMNHVSCLAAGNVRQLWVFEGPTSPPQKRSEVEGRREKRKQARLALAKLLEMQKLPPEQGGRTPTKYELVRAAQECTGMEQSHIDDCKRVLTILGVPWMEAPYEAESQCADLCKRGLVDAVLSRDSDVLVFGGSVLLREISFSSRALFSFPASSSSFFSFSQQQQQQQNKRFKAADGSAQVVNGKEKEKGGGGGGGARRQPERIRLQAVLQGLRITLIEFVDLCLLLGCDYSLDDDHDHQIQNQSQSQTQTQNQTQNQKSEHSMLPMLSRAESAPALKAKTSTSSSFSSSSASSKPKTEKNNKISGIAEVRAYELIQKHHNLETILRNIDVVKHRVPESWFKPGAIQRMRDWFLRPVVAAPSSPELVAALDAFTQRSPSTLMSPEEQKSSGGGRQTLSRLYQFLIREKGWTEHEPAFRKLAYELFPDAHGYDWTLSIS
jgi:5'-3' exonuclease